MGRRYEPEEYREWYLDGVAESMGVPSIPVSPRLAAEWDRFEEALDDVLQEELTDEQYDEATEADPPFNVFATLAGEGVGIWDGRWSHFLDEGEIARLTKKLEQRLGGFVDNTGGGSLPEMMMDELYAANRGAPNPTSSVTFAEGAGAVVMSALGILVATRAKS